MHGVPERSVEALKKKYGSAVAEFVSDQKLIQIPTMGHRTKGVLRRNLAAIIEARLTDIAELVKTEIKNSGYAGRLSFGMVLTGGSAAIEHIDELFHRVTGYEVRVATASCGLDEGSRNGIEYPEHTAAVALLLKGAEHGICSVSFRPTVVPPRQPATSKITTPEQRMPEQRMPENIVDKKTVPNPDDGERKEPEPQPATTNGGGRGRWFGNMIKKLTDGINNTFENADDEEI